MSLPMIAGLYPYSRGGVTSRPVVTLREIPESLRVNPMYRDRLLVLAGDRYSADLLEGFGLRVYGTFDDAPAFIHRDAAHMMKHWMCRWALAEFGEFLWIDWDTVCLREPDAAFEARVRSVATPRFIRIPGYWATVNCGGLLRSFLMGRSDGAQLERVRVGTQRRVALAVCASVGRDRAP